MSRVCKLIAHFSSLMPHRNQLSFSMKTALMNNIKRVNVTRMQRKGLRNLSTGVTPRFSELTVFCFDCQRVL